VKILIAADMEGITGVVHWDHVDPRHKDYARFQKLMTADVNAAVRGAFDGGVREVIVADGHHSGRNILVEELDPRATLHAGSPSPLAMVQGLDAGVSAAMFVGYHARMGTKQAILDHTWSSSSIAGVWLNDLPMGEIGWNAVVCGELGVPLIMISGDQSACAEAASLVGAVETAIVKQASGRMSAECLPPEVARQRIYDAATRAIEQLRQGRAPEPLRLQQPVALTVELIASDMADRAEILPGARRLEGKTIEVVSATALDAYRAFRALAALARS
jgi:D-amino peptidase